MPIVDHATRLITCKLVYCGPARSGKTTNVTYLHGALPETQVGELTSLATRTERTVYFDYLPVDLGTVGGYRVRFRLYTAPGQSQFAAMRALVLQGADGVAFIADSQRSRMDENVASLQDLHAHLAQRGVDVRTLPLVMQYNKRDLPDALVASVDELSAALNFRGVPEFPADAVRGQGVFPTLRALGARVLTQLGAADGATAARRVRAAMETPIAGTAAA